MTKEVTEPFLIPVNYFVNISFIVCAYFSFCHIDIKHIEMFVFKFHIVYIVHRNQLHKQTNKMQFCMYLFYNFCALYMFRTTISFIIRIPQVTVSAALVSRLELPTVRPSSWARLNGLYKAPDTVTCELLMMKEMVVRNM